MALKDIIGQDAAIGILLGTLRRDRLPGSYLFTGESGIGKRTTALNLAKAVNCLHLLSATGSEGGLLEDMPQSSVGTLDACDVCESCRKIDAGTHPDVLVIAPEERQIRIEEIRMIEESLSLRPFEGRKKVVVVDDADTMNAASANAFLKTLEEPPPESLIVLIAARPDRLPQTIRSRCSAVAFHTLSLDACQRILGGRVAPEDMAETARLSHGRPGLAVSGDVREERDWFVELLRAMLRSEKDSWASREEVEKWLDLSLALMRDLAVLKIMEDPDRLINADLAENLATLGKSVDLQGIIGLHKELSFIRSMSLFNLNKSLTWNYTASLLRKELTA